MYSLDASTKHNDMKGTIAIDWHNVNGGNLYSLVASLGIDTSKYTPVALKFTILPPDTTAIRVYVVEENDERKKYDSLVEFIRSKEGKLPVIEFTKKVDLNEFLKTPEYISIFLNSLHEYLVAEDFEIVAEYNLGEQRQ